MQTKIGSSYGYLIDIYGRVLCLYKIPRSVRDHPVTVGNPSGRVRWPWGNQIGIVPFRMEKSDIAEICRVHSERAKGIQYIRTDHGKTPPTDYD